MRVSVITVCFNAIQGIEKTISSVLCQSFPEIEYIVIDGGSQDGTVDVIKKHADRINYFVSEPDCGIYDAMNKGVDHCTGDWINILNSGDVFVDKYVLERCMQLSQTEADVIYGNSREISKGKSRHIEAYADPGIMDLVPAYRHGASFVKAKVHKANKFDLCKRAQLGYALDWELIHRLYKQGFRFCKLNLEIQSFQKEGISDNTIRSFWYNYLITSEGRFNLRKFIHFIRITTTSLIKGLFS